MPTRILGLPTSDLRHCFYLCMQNVICNWRVQTGILISQLQWLLDGILLGLPFCLLFCPCIRLQVLPNRRVPLTSLFPVILAQKSTIASAFGSLRACWLGKHPHKSKMNSHWNCWMHLHSRMLDSAIVHICNVRIHLKSRMVDLRLFLKQFTLIWKINYDCTWSSKIHSKGIKA